MALLNLPLLRHPAFLVGLGIRLGCVLLLVPLTWTSWFLPFLSNTALPPSLDPWTVFLSTGLANDAFPYGIAMYVLLAPAGMIAALTGSPIGLGVTIILIEVVMAHALLILTKGSQRAVLYGWWLSPIVLFICYWHGQLDIIPVTLLTIAIVALRRGYRTTTGLALGAAVAAKYSMAIAVPHIFLYLLRLNAGWRGAVRWLAITATATILLMLPTLVSEGGRAMAIATPEVGRLFLFAMPMGDVSLLLTPLLYGLLLYYIWVVGRTSFSLMLALMALGFFTVVVLSPAAPGWTLWLMPFLVVYAADTGRSWALQMALFTISYLLYHGTSSSGPMIGASWSFETPLLTRWGLKDSVLEALLYSAYVGNGAIIAWSIARYRIVRNEHFRLSRRRPLVSIAGDSGTGKDTLAAAVIDALGQNRVAHVSGDDYHHWDRNRPMWQTLTHLHPAANDLASFSADVLMLLDGGQVRYRHYDHDTGRKTRLLLGEPRDVVIASGLHALYPTALSNRSDVGIYLDMDEGLRRQLKVDRDTSSRGKSTEEVVESIERRVPDAERFVHPQRDIADVVFSLQPEQAVASPTEPLLPEHRWALRAICHPSRRMDRLLHILPVLANLPVSVTRHTTESHPSGSIDIVVRGTPDQRDIAACARLLAGDVDWLIDEAPVWHGGLLGVMQLIATLQIIDALERQRDRLAVA